MNKLDVKTWDDLAVYADRRAKRAAGKLDANSWAHWEELRRWANSTAYLHSPGMDFTVVHRVLEECEDAYRQLHVTQPHAAAFLYAKAKWARTLLRNNGEKVDPLPLDWLKEKAK